MLINQEMDTLCLTLLEINNKRKTNQLEVIQKIYHEHCNQEITERLKNLKTQLDTFLKNNLYNQELYKKIEEFDNIKLYITELFGTEIPVALLKNIQSNSREKIIKKQYK